jgi:hypothetical protein
MCGKDWCSLRINKELVKMYGKNQTSKIKNTYQKSKISVSAFWSI